MLAVNVVSLDHAVESLAIHGQNARRGLFVAARVFENTSYVPSFDLRKRDPVVVGGPSRSGRVR